ASDRGCSARLLPAKFRCVVWDRWLMQDLTVNWNGAAVNWVLTQLELGGHGRLDLKTHLGFYRICVCLRSRLGGAAHLSTLLIMGAGSTSMIGAWRTKIAGAVTVGGHRFCMVVAGVRTRSARFAEDADEQPWPPAAFFAVEIEDLKSAWQDEEDGRPRSAGFPLAGGGLRGGSMGKMEHRISERSKEGSRRKERRPTRKADRGKGKLVILEEIAPSFIKKVELKCFRYNNGKLDLKLIKEYMRWYGSRLPIF
ncbi:hypothetical protein ACLOJK_014581, partial [Asimina triloba]